jgi:hypothetical protein
MTIASSHFTPTQWDTAQEKAAFAKHFMQFVRSDFTAKHFTDKFYRRLSNTFGHIAHYNRGGFWETFFTTTADKVRFLEQTLQHPCYGDPAWTYSDVERSLQAWLRAEGTLDQYRQRLTEETEAAERTELARLQRKYGQQATASAHNSR